MHSWLDSKQGLELPGPDLGVVGGAGVVPEVPVPWNSTLGGGTVGFLLLTGCGALEILN